MNKTLIFVLLLSPLLGQDADTALKHAREVNLERAAKLPSFIADEYVMRYKSRHVNPPDWKFADTIESELEVHGDRFQRQNTRINGKAWNKPSFPSFTWSVSFGEELKPLFDPECHTAMEFDRREENGLAYKFKTPPGCFGGFTVQTTVLVVSNTKRYQPEWFGRFLIDPAGNVVQFENNANRFPKGFGADPWKSISTWDYVVIGDAKHLLPVKLEIFGGFIRLDLWHVVVEYKNHRHFESTSDITFK
jgi:hypothetical protein